MSRPTFYCFQAEGYGAAFEAAVNGVPLAIDRTGNGFTRGLTINEWLAPAENVLEVVAANALDESIDVASARLAVLLFEADPAEDTPVAGVKIAEVLWPAPDCAPELPFRVALPANPRVAPGGELWSAAEAVETLGEGDRARILALVEEFRAALAGRRLEQAFDLAKYRFEEDVRANGTTLDGLRRSVLQGWNMFTDQPGVRLPPLTADVARYRIAAGGRLVGVERSGGRSTVDIHGSRITAGVDLWFAKVGGDWRIAR